MCSPYSSRWGHLKEKSVWFVQCAVIVRLKIFQSDIEPSAICGSKLLGPLMYQGFENGDNNQLKPRYAEFCKIILKVQRSSHNNACRAELRQYPLSTKIEKLSTKFWTHIQVTPTLIVLKPLIAKR